MRKASLFVAAFLTGLLFASSQPQFVAFAQETSIDRVAQDRALAGRIRQLTNRSTDGLKQTRIGSNGVSVDLEDRFQNVMLSRIGNDGEPVAACVTGIDEANAFFGRNLETGEILTSGILPQDDVATLAARHGMSRDEFLFYTKLIEDAAIRRAQSPTTATITIVNADGAGEGFNDPTAATPEGNNNGTTRGEQRLNLFNFAAGIWGAYLDSTVAVSINSQFNSLTPCTTSGGVLGSAGTTNVFRDFSSAQYAGTWYHAALANKRSGSDLNGANPEINARFNTDVDNGCLGTGTRFYYGLDNTTPSGRINLLVVLLHEMGHGLGFSSFANGSTGVLFNGLPDVFTRFMYDRTVSKYWYEMTDAERQASAINPNNVFWDGANVKIASGFLTNGREAGTGRVALYTPSTFQSGSSVSHFSTATTPNLLMEPNINTGLPINLDLTRQVMRDIGWYADATGDVVADSITNVRPSGGTLVIGSSINITWTNTGGFNRNVTIDLSIDGGTTYTAIATNITNTGSFTFTVPNTVTTQGRLRVREADFVDPAGVSAANFAISTTVPRNRATFDFDGDGKADISVFRPSNGAWYIQQSQAGFTGLQFGISTDKLAPADYDGDGKTDVAVVRNGTWYLQRSQAGFTGISFGDGNDVPVPADYNGDGKADIAVFRPSNGYWYILDLTTGQFTATQFGQNGDKPVAADYDGDGKADIAVNRSGNWYIQRSQLGFTGIAFGDGNDKAVPADYDGDGKSDIAVFRPSNGTWYLQQSTAGFTGLAFGLGTDVPVAADYDGDGKADVAVVRSGNWYLNRTTQGFTGIQFGTSADLPIPNSFVR